MLSFALVRIFIEIQGIPTRKEGLAALAKYTNASDVFLFGKDAEIGIFLPVQGLPQTLRHGIPWQAFIEKCANQYAVKGVLPSPNGNTETPAFGIADRMGLAALIFFGAELDDNSCAQISELLPLVGLKLAGESAAQSATGNSAAARSANEHARSLNIALDKNRRELQKAFERAEKELIQRRDAEEQLRDVDRRKDEFLAMLAHELRNPLAPISMAAQIIKLPPGGKEQIEEASRTIDRQVKHMTSLLDDLLDVSRVTRGQITLEKMSVELGAVVAHAVEQTRPFIEQSEHRLVLDLAPDPVCILGDPTRIVQIVANLLNNASKYTPKGGEIALQLAYNEFDVSITVSDNGIGIDGALMPRVFELFTQGERSSDRTQGGLGLGLALVKSLVEFHGGTVNAQSGGLGRGSQFTVRFPRLLEISQPVPRMAKPAGGKPSRPLRVMVVDDNIDAADTLAAFLEAFGHVVFVAYHADAAIPLARQHAPEVLLLDIGLPDINGHELAKTLRTMPQTANSTFVAVTGYGQAADQQRSREAGFKYHLTKPADAAKIIDLIDEVALRLMYSTEESM